RFNLRQDLALLDTIVLFHQKTDDAAGDHLRSDVDDVRLDESVVGDGVIEAVAPPLNTEYHSHDRYPNEKTPDGPANEVAARVRGRRRHIARSRGCGWRSCRRLGRIGCHDRALPMPNVVPRAFLRTAAIVSRSAAELHFATQKGGHSPPGGEL